MPAWVRLREQGERAAQAGSWAGLATHGPPGWLAAVAGAGCQLEVLHMG